MFFHTPKQYIPQASKRGKIEIDRHPFDDVILDYERHAAVALPLYARHSKRMSYDGELILPSKFPNLIDIPRLTRILHLLLQSIIKILRYLATQWTSIEFLREISRKPLRLRYMKEA